MPNLLKITTYLWILAFAGQIIASSAVHCSMQLGTLFSSVDLNASHSSHASHTNHASDSNHASVSNHVSVSNHADNSSAHHWRMSKQDSAGTQNLSIIAQHPNQSQQHQPSQKNDHSAHHAHQPVAEISEQPIQAPLMTADCCQIGGDCGEGNCTALYMLSDPSLSLSIHITYPALPFTVGFWQSPYTSSIKPPIIV